MNALRLLCVGVITIVLTAQASAIDKADKADNAKLIVGKWEVTKEHKDLPVGAVLEFTKDGKMKVSFKKDGMDISVSADYKVEDDKIQYTLKLDVDVKKEPLIIKKLSEKELILEGPDSSKIELKRIK